MAHPFFTPELWLWVIEEDERSPVGLGTAELDTTIGEASLEWIQELPNYRGRSLATAIVVELLTQVQDRAEFTPVSGKVNNHTKPERLYQRYFFTGDDLVGAPEINYV